MVTTNGIDFLCKGIGHIGFSLTRLHGNGILRKGEANLPKKCVINITQIKSADKSSIKEKIGTLSKRKIDEVYEGLKLALAD
ncbi:MAG: type II toxin-antitoxin system PemK/MazF family toxin [Nitrospinales bacterium]